jgi:N-methylhydantoinase A
VAERLGIPRVLIPRYPGVLCALGLLLADVQQHFSRAIDGQLDETIGARLESLAEDLRQAARAQLRRDGFREDQIQLSLSLDLRYQGQSYELPLAIDSSLAPEVLAEGFHALHTRTYGYRLDRPIEVINLRLLAQGGVEKPDFPREALLINDGEAALIGHKPLLCREGWRVGAMYLRELLRPGAYLQGPALILQQDSTSFIPPGWALRVDEYRNLIIQTGIV